MTTPVPDKAKPMDMAAFVTRLLQWLRLPPDADADTIMEALEKAMANPDPAKFVPASAVQDMLRDHHLKVATQREEAAEAKVADAFRKGYLTTPMKEWALSLCRSDPDAFDDFLRKSVPAFGHLVEPTRPGLPSASRSPAATSSEALSICQQLGLKPEDLRH